MKNLILATCLLFASQVYAQVTIDNTSLPEIGDAIVYDLFFDFQDTLTYRENGADLTWSYDDLVTTQTVTERYASIDGTALADSFPDANMIIQIGFFESAALRTDNSIEVVGVLLDGFEDFGVEGGVDLGDNYTIMEFPVEHGNTSEDAFAVRVSISAEMIPGLDSLELPFPGATLDSLRFTVEQSKTEEATAWGTLSLDGRSHDVLKVEQTDVTETTIEIGANLFGTIVWLDLIELLGTFGGDMGGFGDFGFADGETKTYRFLSPDIKGSLLEFTEQRGLDTLDNATLTVSGRVYNSLTSNIAEIEEQNRYVRIFPNPTQDYIHIEVEDLNKANIIIRSYDGKVMLQKNGFSVEERLDIRSLDSGIYILELHHNDQVISKILQKL